MISLLSCHRKFKHTGPPARFPPHQTRDQIYLAEKNEGETVTGNKKSTDFNAKFWGSSTNVQNDDTAWNLYSDKYNVGAVFMFSWGKKHDSADHREAEE